MTHRTGRRSGGVTYRLTSSITSQNDSKVVYDLHAKTKEHLSSADSFARQVTNSLVL
jgi:hypothetical protein